MSWELFDDILPSYGSSSPFTRHYFLLLDRPARGKGPANQKLFIFKDLHMMYPDNQDSIDDMIDVFCLALLLFSCSFMFFIGFSIGKSIFQG